MDQFIAGYLAGLVGMAIIAIIDVLGAPIPVICVLSVAIGLGSVSIAKLYILGRSRPPAD